jgi:hypothetical protein
LVSWSITTSGRFSSSHGKIRGRRARTLLTFQVAMRMARRPGVPAGRFMYARAEIKF